LDFSEMMHTHWRKSVRRNVDVPPYARTSSLSSMSEEMTEGSLNPHDNFPVSNPSLHVQHAKRPRDFSMLWEEDSERLEEPCITSRPPHVYQRALRSSQRKSWTPWACFLRERTPSSIM
jgi:hypothetical protein